jgi:spore coat polysaccharide biosynthesis protein SpsF (cytidylyltransferase family)
MADISSKTNFAHHAERMKSVKGLDGVFLATSVDPKNQVLIEEAERLGCGWFAGPEQDILERHIALCKRENADAVIRVTCDCPLFDIDLTSKFVEEFKRQYHDFIFCSNFPMLYGTLSELLSCKILSEIHEFYRGPGISRPLRENLNKYDTVGIEQDHDLCRPEYRLTLDVPEDLELIRKIYGALYSGTPLNLREVYTWLDDNPEIAYINRMVESKGCNQYSANLMERPLYSIVPSGTGYVILDSQKRFVEPKEFRKKLKEFFPDTD